MKKFMCTLLVMMSLMCTNVYAADYKTDINNYTFEGQELIPERFREQYVDTMQYLPNYYLDNFLKNGGVIKFVNTDLLEDEMVAGVNTYNPWDNTNVIQVKVNPKVVEDGMENYIGCTIAKTLKHELGHYYDRHYTDKLSWESRAELKKTAEYNKKYVNSCYNDKESFAEEFALMYSPVGDTLWGTNYSVPYDELERTIKKEMGIQDDTSRITGGIINVY